jgi:hypothetical protein
MKYILAILLFASTSQASKFDPLAEDKLKHMGVSTLISGVTYKMARNSHYSVIESSVVAMSMVMLANLAKEMYDFQKGGVADINDVNAGLIGGGLGLAIGWTF